MNTWLESNTLVTQNLHMRCSCLTQTLTPKLVECTGYETLQITYKEDYNAALSRVSVQGPG